MMSADTDGYTPASQPSPLSPAQQLGTQPSATPKLCSVRGCSNALLPDSSNKMCEACRGRHRIYASTKRARRKLEKAAVVGIRRIEQLDTPANTSIASGSNDWGTQPTATAAAAVAASTPPVTIAPATTWDNTAIDPQLFSEPAPGASSTTMHHLMTTFARPSFPTSSSSELAGALTLPVATTSDPSGSTQQSQTTYYREEEEESNSNSESDGGDEEHEVSANLQSIDADSDAPQTISQGSSTDPKGPPRACSVKGCKAMIPASYTFKMCPPCRTRYRTYGNTKRAKWKAEREAFDRELAGLRTKEDDRRRVAGERPLSESPEDLRAWELSIIDEEVPISPSTAVFSLSTNTTGETHSVDASGKPIKSFGNGMYIAGELLSNMTMMQPTGTIESVHSHSPYPTSPLATVLPLPARMCTVSHCHKILPGFYRYKRCEQHRLQNRYHSQLKRVREKVVKRIGPNGEEEYVVLDEDGEEGDERKQRKKKEKKKKADDESEEGQGKMGDPDDGEDQADDEEDKGKEREKPRKRNFVCATDECHNLLMPGVRWRNCEYCRARERVFKREKKELEEGAAREVERLREIVRLMETGAIPVGQASSAAESVGGSSHQPESENEKKDGADNSIVEDQQESGDVDMPHVGDGNQQPPAGDDHSMEATASPPTPAPISTPAASTGSAPTPQTPGPFAFSTLTTYTNKAPGTFQSVFRATPTPNTFVTPDISNTETRPPEDTADSPATSTANLITSDAPLTFRAYKPKTATSIAARHTGQNPDLSVQVFKDLLLHPKAQTNNGLVGESSYHVYKSIPPALAREPTIFVPTVPTSAPFVYQPPHSQRRKFKTNTENNSDGGGQEQTKQGDKTPEGTGTSPSSNNLSEGNAIASSSETNQVTVESSSNIPSPSVIPRQRKPRASRAKAPPTSKLLQPAVPGYSYAPGTQYPYPYYMAPPYGMGPYGMPMASQPSTATSSSAATPPSSSPYSSMHPSPYQYAYQSYAYHPQGYPAGAPPPGYGYLPPRYPPGPYGQPHQPYTQQQQLQPGTYPASYGYAKEGTFAYYQPPVPSTESPAETSPPTKKKRKRDEGEPQPAASTTVTATAPVPSVVAEPYSLHPTNIISPPILEPVPAPATESTNGTQAEAIPESAGSLETPDESVSKAQARPCANKTCHRTIPADVIGTLCEKCKIRIKKHQVKARHRYKLEPRKSVLGGASIKKEDSGPGSVPVAA